MTSIGSFGTNSPEDIGSPVKFEFPTRIAITEDIEGTLGLDRAWAVMEHLTTGQGLDKKQFSISAASIVTQESTTESEQSSSGADDERMLEIVLLERSVYN